MSYVGVISPNTEILLLSCVGLAFTLYEVTWKQVENPSELIWEYRMPDKLKDGQYIIKSVIYLVELVRAFTVHVYIASYLLIYYPVLTEHRRFLLVPWLILTAIRAIVLNLIVFLLGILICVSWDNSITSPCLVFTAGKAVNMGAIIYFFLTVHDFYYHLGTTSYHWLSRKKILLSRLLTGNQVDKVSQGTRLSDDSLSIDSDEMLTLDGKLGAVDRLLADATLEWFLNEAFGFDDIDDEEYEKGLAERAEHFLRLSAKDILQQKDKICPHVEELVRNAKLKRCLEYLKKRSKTPRASPESEHKDPLSRYPYLEVSFDKKPPEMDAECYKEMLDNLEIQEEMKQKKEEQEEEMKLAELEERVNKIEVKRKEMRNNIVKESCAERKSVDLCITAEKLFEKMQRRNSKQSDGKEEE